MEEKKKKKAGSERRRPTERADTVSLKHKGDSWRWGRSRGKIRAEGRKRQKEKDTDSFLCLPHCLPARSLPLSSYLAVLPLTSSQRPLSFFISFVALPPSSFPIHFLLYGRHLLRNDHSSFFPIPNHLVPFLGYLSTFKLLFPSISPPSHSFSSITIKMVAVETRLFGNGGRGIIPALCFVCRF